MLNSDLRFNPWSFVLWLLPFWCGQCSRQKVPEWKGGPEVINYSTKNNFDTKKELTSSAVKDRIRAVALQMCSIKLSFKHSLLNREWVQDTAQLWVMWNFEIKIVCSPAWCWISGHTILHYAQVTTLHSTYSMKATNSHENKQN